MIDLVKDAKARTFWNKMTVEEQQDANLIVKWHSQGFHKNFIPTRDILKRIWEKSKPMDVVTILKHPKFGSFSGKHEEIEVSDEENSFLSVLFLIHFFMKMALIFFCLFVESIY